MPRIDKYQHDHVPVQDSTLPAVPHIVLPQGRGDTCPSAVEMYRINWATAIAALDSSNFGVGQVSTFTVPATYKDSKNVVIVKPDWMAAYKFNLYFSLRRKVRPL